MNTNAAGKILIVDDNEVNRYSTARILRSAGYESVDAASGQEGLSLCLQRPELVLLDVNLPDIDGFQVCKQLRSDPRTADIPIVHTSATFVSDDDRIQGLDVGADGYLTRPFEPRVLIATIRACLRARRAESERAKFAKLVEQSRDLIAIYDAQWVPTYMNQAGLNIVGIDAVEYATIPLIKRLLGVGDLSWLEEEFLPKVLREGHGECEVRISNQRTGKELWMNCRMGVQKNEHERVVGYFAVCREVSEQKALEEKLRTVVDDLSASNRKLNEFLATLAHELRNPMSPIRMGLELIRIADDDVSAIQQARTMMERQALQMIRLIDDLLDLSRITQGKLTLRQAQLDIADVISMAVDAIRPAANEARHELEVSLPDDPIVLVGDPNRLAQVFANILNNAVKYTRPEGRISIAAKRDFDRVAISIRDNGLGIPTAMQQSIFEMFTQIDRSIEEGYTGLGIGLTLVKRLVEMHHGTISVHSAGQDQGSEFIVRLPCKTDVADVAVEHLESNTPHSRHRVLVVDDNRDSAALLGLVLKVLGNEIELAHDGLEAVATAQLYRPTIILMDLGMPKMNGYDAAREIRRHDWGKKMILVALTGWGQDEDKKRTHHAGFDFHLTKPAEPAAIQQILDSVRMTDVT